MRSGAAAVAFLAVALCGVVATVVAGASDERELAFTLGVAPGLVAVELPPGGEACQEPVAVAERFDGLRVQVGTYERRGEPVAVTVRRLGGNGAVLARGRLPGGYPDVSQPDVALDRAVPAGERAAVCFRNEGSRRLALYGGPDLARRRSTVTVRGRDQATDLTILFTQPPRTALAQVPDIFERASLFRPAWIGPWAYWLLAGLLLIAVPALLALALRDGFAGDRRSAGADRPHSSP